MGLGETFELEKVFGTPNAGPVPDGCKRCGKPKQSWQEYCGAACSAQRNRPLIPPAEESIARENRAVEQAQRDAHVARTWKGYLIELDAALDYWIERAHA